MPLTRQFRESVQARARTDKAFRAALLAEAVNAMMQGDVEAGKAVLRDYVNATIGFDTLAKKSGRPAKSLMRMLSDTGNPQAQNLFTIIAILQQETKTRLRVAA